MSLKCIIYFLNAFFFSFCFSLHWSLHPWNWKISSRNSFVASALEIWIIVFCEKHLLPWAVRFMGTGGPGLTEHMDRHCCCSRTCQEGWLCRGLGLAFQIPVPSDASFSPALELRGVAGWSLCCVFTFILNAFSREYVLLSYGESPSIWSVTVFICLLVVSPSLQNASSLFTDILLVLTTPESPAPSTVLGPEMVLSLSF